MERSASYTRQQQRAKQKSNTEQDVLQPKTVRNNARLNSIISLWLGSTLISFVFHFGLTKKTLAHKIAATINMGTHILKWLTKDAFSRFSTQYIDKVVSSESIVVITR